MAMAGMGSVSWAQTLDCTKDVNGAITSVDSCYVQPDEYYMTIYKMGLCTAQPVAPTTGVAADLSSCTTVFENLTGSRIMAVKGVSGKLTGTMARPANGTYTHGYVLAAPQFEIKTKNTFSTPRTAAGDLASPIGSTCWSTSATAYVYTGPTVTRVAYPGTCNATLDPLTHGVAITSMNSFTSYVQNLTPTSTFTDPSGTNAYLVSNTMKLGTGVGLGMGDITRLLGVVPMPVTVSAATTGMDISFKVSQGATLAMCDVANSYCGTNLTANGGSVIYFGGGPFAVQMTLK